MFITCNGLMYIFALYNTGLGVENHNEITTNGRLFYTSFHVGVR